MESFQRELQQSEQIKHENQILRKKNPLIQQHSGTIERVRAEGWTSNERN